MNIDINKSCEKIYQELLQISHGLVNSNENDNSLVKMCIDFEKTWNIEIDSAKIPFQSGQEVANKFDLLKPKIMSNTKKCIVLGRSASGKSTLINALLTETVLSTALGLVSNCFVEIQASSTNENYLLVNNTAINIGDNNNDLRNVWSNEDLENGSYVQLYYDSSKCQLLNEDVIIINTPGLENDTLLDNFVETCCSDADLIILVVNVLQGLSTIEKSFFTRHQRVFSKLRILIVYNFCDVPQSGDMDDTMKYPLFAMAKGILCDQLQYTDREAEANVFFISALERLSIFTNDMIVCSGLSWDTRNDCFATLFECIKKTMSENAFKKKNRYLNELYSVVLSIFHQCEVSVAEMREKRVELSIKLKAALGGYDHLNNEINKQISLIFNEAYEQLLIRGLDELKVEVKVDKKVDHHNISYFLDEDELYQRLARLLEDIIKESLMNLKTKIIEMVSHEDEEISSFRITILKELYFSIYFDLSNEINFFDLHCFKRILVEISRHIKIGSRITIGLTAGATAIGIATGGVAFSIIGLAQASLAMAGLASGGALAGSALGFGTSFSIIKAVKMPFRFAWKKYELDVKAIWDSFESTLSNSYATFLENMTSNITQLIVPIEERSVRTRNSLKSIKEELKNFQNYSLLY